MAQDIRESLYRQGIQKAYKFCSVNDIKPPVFLTYEEAEKLDGMSDGQALRFLQRVADGPLQGTGTGLYYKNHVFVNVPVTALPVLKPGFRNWSYPCYKVDRTAMGVVAHETGHHVEQTLAKTGKLTRQQGAEWRTLLTTANGRRKITNYEPVPSEAWAETMRLFILNPQLLRFAVPARYRFITDCVGLRPSERRPWRDVLQRHPDFVAQAERWIGQA
jgi:hypothetical protein